MTLNLVICVGKCTIFYAQPDDTSGWAKKLILIKETGKRNCPLGFGAKTYFVRSHTRLLSSYTQWVVRGD